jgi:hypothetical protein
MKTANIVELRLRRNSRPEQRRAAPDVFAFHPANGGYRRSIETAILKGLGVVAEGLERALSALEGWGILKGARVMTALSATKLSLKRTSLPHNTTLPSGAPWPMILADDPSRS